MMQCQTLAVMGVKPVDSLHRDHFSTSYQIFKE